MRRLTLSPIYPGFAGLLQSARALHQHLPVEEHYMLGPPSMAALWLP